MARMHVAANPTKHRRSDGRSTPSDPGRHDPLSHEGGKYEKNFGGVKDEKGGQGHMSRRHLAAMPPINNP